MMMISPANFFVILIAAVAAWVFGAAWYTSLSGQWMAAQGRTKEEMQAAFAGKSTFAKAWPFVLSLIGGIIMAWMMYGLLFHMGSFSARRGAITGTLIWLGFILTTVLVNNTYQGRKLTL